MNEKIIKLTKKYSCKFSAIYFTLIVQINLRNMIKFYGNFSLKNI